jgi:hypothetical protein
MAVHGPDEERFAFLGREMLGRDEGGLPRDGGPGFLGRLQRGVEFSKLFRTKLRRGGEDQGGEEKKGGTHGEITIGDEKEGGVKWGGMGWGVRRQDAALGVVAGVNESLS